MNAGKVRIGYAIMTKKGNLQLFDSRLPIYWRRKVAVSEMAARNIDGVIVRVTIDEDA